jgi:hypothetical protein
MDRTTEKDVIVALNVIERMVGSARYEILRTTEGVATLRTPGAIEAALRELAAASEDKDGHFARWPAEDRRDWESQSVECRDDWSRALRRFEAAIEKLVRVAKALPAVVEPPFFDGEPTAEAS